MGCGIVKLLEPRINHSPISCFTIRSPQDALRQKQWGPFTFSMVLPVLVPAPVLKVADIGEYRQSILNQNHQVANCSCHQSQ